MMISFLDVAWGLRSAIILNQIKSLLKIAFKILFIQANRCLTVTGGVNFRDNIVREIDRVVLASVLLTKHDGEDVVLNMSSRYSRRL